VNSINFNGNLNIKCSLILENRYLIIGYFLLSKISIFDLYSARINKPVKEIMSICSSIYELLNINDRLILLFGDKRNDDIVEVLDFKEKKII
jgi:hypothetical protein